MLSGTVATGVATCSSIQGWFCACTTASQPLHCPTRHAFHRVDGEQSLDEAAALGAERRPVLLGEGNGVNAQLVEGETGHRRRQRVVSRQQGISSAVELKQEQKERIEQKLIETTKYQKIEGNYKVDPSLIGGLVIRVADTVVDSSLKTQIAKLSKSLVQ